MSQVCQTSVRCVIGMSHVQLASLPTPLTTVYIGCLFLHRFNQHTSGNLPFFLPRGFTKSVILTPYCTRSAVAVKALPLPMTLPLTLLLKLSTSLPQTSLPLLLLLNQVFLPPRFQAFCQIDGDV
jgi:hypothetical protein